MLVDFRPHARLRGKNPVDFTTSVTPVLEALARRATQARRPGPGAGGLRLGAVPGELPRRRRRAAVLAYPATPVRPDQPPQPAGPPPTTGRSPWTSGAAAACRCKDADRRPAARRAAPAGSSWRTGARAARAASGTSTRCTGRPSSCGRRRPATATSRRCPAGRATRATATRPATWSASCSRSGSGWRCRGAARPSCTWPSWAWATAARPRCSWTSSGSWTRPRPRLLPRLHYLMCDYSQHVLDLAGETVARACRHVSSVALDATRPRTSLGFLRGRIFLLYISNVYDNLPTDEVAQLGGRAYLVHTRAYFPPAGAAELASVGAATPAELPGAGAQAAAARPGLLPDAAPGHFATSTPRWRSGGEPGPRCGWPSATSRSRDSTCTRWRRR